MLALEVVAFMAVSLAVFHVLPASRRAAWLLFASYVFYGAIAWQFVPVIALLSLATYAIGNRVRDAHGQRSVTALWLGIGLNVGVLLGFRAIFPVTPFEAPFAVIGLSFYTLQAISYLADRYSGVLKTGATLPQLSLYLAYFPKLLAGPIERAKPFLQQLAAPRPVDDDGVARAFTLIAAGITRKVVVADPLRQLLPAEAFTSPAEVGAIGLAAALIGFAVVLYNDFAGYTQMARGISLLFGIELSPNFARPFFATSFTDFWNRWHITLSFWLRDYLYLPLSRFFLRRDPRLWNLSNLVWPPLVTMVVSGVWHGGSWHMLVWGGLHGLYLIGERVVVLMRAPRRTGVPSRSAHVASVVVVFTLGTVAFAFFRMDITTAVAFLRGMATGPLGAVPPIGAYLACLTLSLWLDWMQTRHGDSETFFHWPRPLRAALLALVLVLWFVCSSATPPAPFIYRGF